MQRWRRNPSAAASLLILLALVPSCQSIEEVQIQAESPAATLDAGRLQRLHAAFEEAVENGEIAGAVCWVSQLGETVVERSYGFRDVEAQQPMTVDTLFRIASMSKAVTSVAVMMLYEEGRFRLSDPAARFVPYLANPRVVTEVDGEAYETEPARRPITIGHLLTHTAGLTYGSGTAAKDFEAANLQGWYFADRDETIGEALGRLEGIPLACHPGEQWHYGYSTDILGHLVEVVSGQPLDDFFRERIFEPLQMTDTCFFVSKEQAPRLAPVYGREAGGKISVRETNETSDYVVGPRSCFSGGAGLISTAKDYGRFLQMLLQGGSFGNEQILSPKSVQLMTTNHTGDLFSWGRGQGFGLGFWVLEDLGEHGELGSVGSYGWGSAYYPVYFIDPEEQLIAFFLTQLMPSGGLDLNQRFPSLVYQALPGGTNLSPREVPSP